MRKKIRQPNGFVDFPAHKNPHTVCARARERLGSKVLAQRFASLREQRKPQGYRRAVCSVVDAAQLMRTVHWWQERDKAARMGCTGRHK